MHVKCRMFRLAVVIPMSVNKLVFFSNCALCWIFNSRGSLLVIHGPFGDAFKVQNVR